MPPQFLYFRISPPYSSAERAYRVPGGTVGAVTMCVVSCVPGGDQHRAGLLHPRGGWLFVALLAIVAGGPKLVSGVCRLCASSSDGIADPLLR